MFDLGAGFNKFATQINISTQGLSREGKSGAANL